MSSATATPVSHSFENGGPTLGQTIKRYGVLFPLNLERTLVETNMMNAISMGISPRTLMRKAILINLYLNLLFPSYSFCLVRAGPWKLTRWSAATSTPSSLTT